MGHPIATKREIEDKLELESLLTKRRKFTELRGNPLGSVKTIMFWNDPQKQVEKLVVKMKPTLLIGDYGTGLCRIVMSSS